jgi:hypothetical protein
VIHLPDRELDENGDEAAAPKKRTRRGSRGGRNRKRKTATAAGTAVETVEPETDAEPEIDEPEADEPEIDEPEIDELEIDEPEADEPETDEPEIAAEPAESQNGSDEWQYTPMSEWDLGGD